MGYRFERFDDLAGFNNPIDVRYDTVYLGTLETKPDGFVIVMLDTPTGKVTIKKTQNNKFKTEQEAAETLHRVWKSVRQGEDDLYEDHGLGFSHNVSMPQDDNTMNKPTIKEYGDSKTRAKAVHNSDYDRALALMFTWIRNGEIDYAEFEELESVFVAKFVARTYRKTK